MSRRDPIAEIADELSPEVRGRALSLYAALGDSFTAGSGCGPGEAWPQLLGGSLRASSPALELRNLAAHGATSAEVLEQLPEALELEPDLVTVVFGANDVLTTTRPEPATYARRLDRILAELLNSNPGVRIVTATSPECWHFLKCGPRTGARISRGIAAVNAATRVVAGAHGVACLDVVGHPGLSEPENFSADGLHPSPLGHRRAARAFAALVQQSFGIEIAVEGGADD